jgi:nucleotide-binding universal stress UspA family protein
MKKILVPVDFSGHTEITCKYAMELAKVYSAEIHIFHTFFDQIILADTSFPDTLDMSTIYNEELMKEIFHQAERNMKELQEKLESQILKENITNITLTTSLVAGEIEHELKIVCKEYHPDMVIMGTRGKGNNINIWGKVSTFIIDHARVPVLTLPEIKTFRGFRNIMFAADLNETNSVIIPVILELFKAYDIQLSVIHFLNKSKVKDEYNQMKALQGKFAQEEKQNLIRFEMVVYEDDNQKVIDQFVSDNQIDLIAFQPHKRGLFYMIFTRNITKKNLFATNIPLLAIPAGIS